MMSLPKLFFSILHTINSNDKLFCAQSPFSLLQTILVGDSGVGKTSLLVQFDQGKFQAGSFSATVGIGFTVGQPSLGAPSPQNLSIDKP